MNLRSLLRRRRALNAEHADLCVLLDQAKEDRADALLNQASEPTPEERELREEIEAILTEPMNVHDYSPACPCEICREISGQERS